MRSITRLRRSRRWTDNPEYRPDKAAKPSMQRELTASATRIQFR